MNISKSFTQTLQHCKQYIGYTNRVLYVNKKNNEVEYFLPAYLRLVVKKVSEFNYSQSKAKIIATLLLTVCYDKLQGIAYDQLEYLLKKNMVIDINGELIQLNQSNEKVVIKMNDPRKHFISYTYRDSIEIELSSQVFLTPFEKIYGEFHVSLKTMQKIKLPIKLEQVQQISSSENLEQKPKKSKKHIASIKFNLMDDVKNPIQKRFQYKGLVKVMGYYQLKKSNFGVQYYEKDYTKFEATNNFLKDINFENKKCERIVKSINKKQEIKKKQDKLPKQLKKLPEGKVKIWQNATFKFQFARHPFIQLVTIMVPLWILSILNLPIFFQELALGARISQIATILLAFTAYLPTIRERIPPSSTLTLIQINIYFLISTSLLCLLRSFIAYQDDPDGKNLDYLWKQDILFIICLIINISSFGIVLIMYILQTSHNIEWYQLYNSLFEKLKKKQPEIKAKKGPEYSDWFNIECDYEFKNNPSIHYQNQLSKQNFQKTTIKNQVKMKQKDSGLPRYSMFDPSKLESSTYQQSQKNELSHTLSSTIQFGVKEKEKKQ